MPFSAGQRVCPGAGFAMIEGPLLLSMLLRNYRFEVVADRPAMPVAHLTVRGRDGIWLRITPRGDVTFMVSGRSGDPNVPPAISVRPE